MQRMIESFETKEKNYTVSINKVFLHSKYYPSKEARNFVQSNIDKIVNKKYIVVYGIGLGYHLKEMLTVINEECRIFAFDCDEEVIKKGEELGMINDIKRDRRITLFSGNNNEFLKEFSKKINSVEDIIIYKPSLRTIPIENEEITNLLNSYELGKIAIERFGHMAQENYRLNIECKPKSIGEFFVERNFRNKPIVIVSGGPSLELDLENLLKYRDNIYVFALGRTVDILVRNKIIPDMITIIDPQEIVYEQIKLYLSLNIPLCFLSTASKDAVRNYNGPKYIFFNDLDVNNKDGIVISTGRSVSIAALDIAIKSGAKNIIFLGQDLAFINKRFHAGDYLEKNIINKGLKKVVGINGEILETTIGLLEFKKNIEKIIFENNDVKFINCSKGAKINGTKEMNFKDVFSFLKQ